MSAFLTGRRRLMTSMGIAAIQIPVAAAVQGAIITMHPDANLLRLLAQFDALEAQIWPAHFGGYSDEVLDTHAAVVAPLKAEQTKLLATICTVRATTLDGVQARARTLLSWDRDIARRVAAGDNPNDYDDDRMMFALMRDLVGEQGA